ncbi:hypothetical protein BDR05DRAFT_953539 [Suillus weaverae]|nr:hypothetical protein BDR05DRAFT_953539 [Suillus weaverae]
MPIGSFDHTKHRLGDYEQRHGNLPDPTVAQLLESHRPFHNTWAETCDKLQKADADLRRMQRVRQSTIEMLEVLETLIDYFEDEDPDTLLYTLPTQYLVHGTRCPVLHAQDGTRDSGFGIWDWDCASEPRTPNFGAWDSGIQDSIFSTCLGPRTRDLKFRTQNSGLDIRNSGLGTRDSGLGTRDSGLGTRDSGLGTRDSGLNIRNLELDT